MVRTLLPSLVLASSIALGQGTVFVPDNQSGIGACNAIPLSASFAASSTYLGRIPASFMNPTLRRVNDIAFAPCNAATFSATNLQMGMGHVSTALPVPFTYPTFDAGGNVLTLGSFLDYHPVWNSVAQGPFTYAMTANAWSPLGFGTAGGTTGFIWNGANDVGYFLTFSGATGGTTCHRTATEPFRAYASGTYQAAFSTGSGAAGLKMELLVGPAPSVTTVGAGCPGTGSLAPVLYTSELPSIGNAAFHVDVAQGLAYAPSFLYVSVGIAPVPTAIGGGCNVFLDLPSVIALIQVGFDPIGPVYLDGGGGGSFPIGIPNDLGFAGIHAGFQAVVVDAGNPNGFTLTNALDALLE